MRDRKRNWFVRLYLWATNRLYNEFAWAYDWVSWGVSFGCWAGWRRTVLGYVHGSRVLEIGFGTGELLIETKARGIPVVGLDLSKAMHHITRRKLKRAGLHVPLVRGATQSLPFPDGTFNTIISTFPAEYILKPGTLIEISRLLSPVDNKRDSRGGRLVVVGLTAVRSRSDKRNLIEKLLGVDGQRLQDEFIRLANDAGLDVDIEMTGKSGLQIPVYILTGENSGLL